MSDVISGRFELVDVLGRGGTGTVWRAWDHKFQALCAAKVLRQRDSADLLRFVREQSITSDHPHLLTPYGWAAEDAHVAIAMPLSAGGSVAEASADFGPFGANLAATILDQLLAGLAELHATGWAHRDVKPANMMLPEPTEGRPKVQLADFGLALHRDDVRFTHTGMVHGTSGFIAPEVLRGAGVGPAQDIYAAGISAIQLLSPLRPLPGAGTTPDLPALQPGFIEMLAAMIAVDPDQRPTAQSARQALRDITGLLDGPWCTADGEPFEVFDHLPPLPLGIPARGAPGAASGVVTADSSGPQSPVSGPAATRSPGSRRRRRRALATALMSLFAVLGGLALVLVPIFSDGQQVPSGPTPPPDQSTEEDATEDGGSESLNGDEAERQEPVDQDQECSWAEESTTRSSDDGGTVTCVRQDDGSYAWEQV